MIKIIISGTSNGFSPRFASDGILDDSVSLSLLDRRRFFSREADRLEKDGYCFQPLEKVGILFHKILLLYDGYGRDGFMMASLFLPKNDILTGTEIKDALDSIVKEYKARTINGMANFDLDWSFVKQKAEELNIKVKNTDWTKLPAKNDNLCTAFIKGAEDHVADFFQYPNPLHRGCAGFGLVFLSESILDPSKASVNGDQGYKILTTEDVDIANPEYEIKLIEQFPQNGSFEGVRKITKKELSQEGDIRIGTYSKPGYRTTEVYIKNNEKFSKDNLAIEVTLPILTQKSATIEIIVNGTDTGEPIPDYTIKWKNASNQVLSLQKQINGKYNFSGESCDMKWFYTIDCGKSYECYSDEIFIKDGEVLQITPKIIHKQLWSIDYILPNGDRTPYKQDIPSDNIKKWIKHVIEYLELNGYDVISKLEDERSFKVTLSCKEHTDESLMGSGKRKETQSGNDKVTTVFDVTPSEKKTHFPENKRKKYFLKLNDKSRNYLLFKNYRKKNNYANKISYNLYALEIEIANLKRDSQYVNTANAGSEIINHIKNGDIDKAKYALKLYLRRTDVSLDLLNKIESIITDIERQKRIPNVVLNPQDITYNDREHRLECERSICPSSQEPIKFNKDYYRYFISAPNWEPENTCPLHENVVRKELLTKYKVAFIATLIVAILAVMIGVKYFIGNGEAAEMCQKYEQKISEMLESCDKLSFNAQNRGHTRYVGDSLFEKLGSLVDEIEKFRNKYNDYKDSLQTEQISEVYNKQQKSKKEDSICYTGCKELLKNFPYDNSLSELPNKIRCQALSQKHYEELEQEYQQCHDNYFSESNLRKLCLSEKATTFDIDNYISKFGNLNGLGERLYEIAKDNSKERDERLSACNLYLDSWPRGIRKSKINQIKKQLQPNKRDMNISTGLAQPDTVQVLHSDVGGQNGGNKTKLNAIAQIFNALLWDNVKNNGKVLNEKYDINEQFQTRVNNLIQKANNIGQKKYSDAYRKVYGMKSSQIGQNNRLYCLEKELGLGQ